MKPFTDVASTPCREKHFLNPMYFPIYIFGPSVAKYLNHLYLLILMDYSHA